MNRLKARKEWFDIQKRAIANFGLPLWIVKKAASKMYPRNRKMGIFLNERKTDLILKYIEDNYCDYLKLPENYDDSLITSDSPIWVCWWQGEDDAPQIIKSCIESIRRHRGNHPVYLITWDNYKTYVDIPEKILSRYKNGDIMPAHMADLLRCKLLTKYGGIWCDATLFFTEDIDKGIENYCFYTIKHSLESSRNLELEPSKCYWRIFFLGAGKGNPLIKICQDVLEAMLLQDKPLINYWTMDYIILWTYRNIPIIAKMIDDVPYNNEMPYRMEHSLGLEYSEQLWEQICTNQQIHKLSWKGKFDNSKNSVYYRRIIRE